MTSDHDHDHDHGHHEHVVSYPDAVAAFRADKDAFFANDPHSPIPLDERPAFTGLPYYPMDEALRFDDLPSSRTPATSRRPSRSRPRTESSGRRGGPGILRFELDGEPASSPATPSGRRRRRSLFVPFLDATSGTETYGAGRYLDLEPDDDGTYVLDFNLAYHPSCVYDPRYSCPLTPAENRLPVRIEAGERLPD